MDPGIGFAKGLEHNLSLLRHCDRLLRLTRPAPLLIGASRKRFLGTILNEPRGKTALKELKRALKVAVSFDSRAQERLFLRFSRPDFKKRSFGNAAALAVAVAKGADVLRVHEVREMRQTAMVCDRIYRAKL